MRHWGVMNSDGRYAEKRAVACTRYIRMYTGRASGHHILCAVHMVQYTYGAVHARARLERVLYRAREPTGLGRCDGHGAIAIHWSPTHAN